MYEIRPESLKTFVEDNTIKLPRFQRKQTWNDKKNFELCISIFKEYPMGVCILNVEEINNRETKWLLDGRQRRNAFMTIWNDPEQIYLWAKKWIGIKNNDQFADIDEKFQEKLSEYLEDQIDDDNDDDKKIASQDNLNEINDVDDNANEVDDTVDRSYNDETVEKDSKGLDFLLEFIKLMHNKNSFCTGLTRPFDFTKFIDNLPYFVVFNGKKQLNSRKWKTFIIEYESYCQNDDKDYEQKDSFIDFMISRFPIDRENQKSLRTNINNNWTSIKDRINIVNKIRDILIKSKIGLIEVKDIGACDAQKIFNIINSNGTKLSAVEVLSAKPSWNLQIINPTEQQIKATEILYQNIAVRYENVVKWDIPATFMKRLTNTKFIFGDLINDTNKSDTQLTMGFKILSGIYEKGVKKDDIDKLGKDNMIKWNTETEDIITNINLICRIIKQFNYFQYLNSWDGSLIKFLSDAISINFLLIMYEDWKRKDKPVGNDSRTKQFQKNSFILVDRLIYEYINRQWRGSSDSKIAKNLSEFNNENDVFRPVDQQKWIDLLKEIFKESSIDSVKITQKVMTPILYHFYCISGIPGPATQLDGQTIEVDHIIPQGLFKNTPLTDSDFVQHNLFNLCLLPKRDNCSKNNKKLNEIHDPWLKDQIKMFAFINPDEYDIFSDITNLEILKEKRSEIFLEAFSTKRNSILNS
ncbi:DUF262 domain-containing protein [bacterium]|nr:DUF262 domain-containing protein [bacterium]